MNVSEILQKAGSFVMPGRRQQTGFLCARCRSFDIELALHENTDPQAAFRLTVRVVCNNCQNYIEIGLVANGPSDK